MRAQVFQGSGPARVASALARRAPIFSAVFVIGAVHPLVALAWPRAIDPSPPWRHALFLGINALFAVAFALRWRWLLVPCFALVAQQSYSHGMDVVRAASEGAW